MPRSARRVTTWTLPRSRRRQTRRKDNQTQQSRQATRRPIGGAGRKTNARTSRRPVICDYGASGRRAIERLPAGPCLRVTGNWPGTQNRKPAAKLRSRVLGESSREYGQAMAPGHLRDCVEQRVDFSQDSANASVRSNRKRNTQSSALHWNSRVDPKTRAGPPTGLARRATRVRSPRDDEQPAGRKTTARQVSSANHRVATLPDTPTHGFTVVTYFCPSAV